MKIRLFRSTRAISPILATLLLIVIAVAAISVTYAWIMTYMGDTTDKAGVSLFEGNINFVDGTPKNVTLDIGNSGMSATQILAVYAGTSESTMQAYTPTYAAGYSSTIAAENFTSFNIALSWAPATTYYFRVVPTAGQQALTFQQTSP